MATNFLTPNMNLLVPVVGQELSPTWASDLNTSLGTVDGHNHSPGSGVPINPSGIVINAALPFNSYPATGLAFVSITPQGAAIPTPVNYAVYTSGKDLFFQDGNGTAIQITSGGTVNATSSGIVSGTNSAAFVSNTLVVLESVGVAAPIDAATYILRYNGSYPTPAGNYIALEAPASLATGYALVLPAAPPGSNGSFAIASTAGVVSFLANNNINFLGNAVQENGKNIVVSETNDSISLSIIRASLSATGGVLSGAGVSCVHNSTGNYTVTVTTGFSDNPAMFVSVNTAGNFSATITQVTGTTFLVITSASSTAVVTDLTFSIFLVGQRA